MPLNSFENDYEDMSEFELDFASACNMMLGKSYSEAVVVARKWVAEAKESV